MLELGATRVLVDGAFDREAAADPASADGLVLVSGAALGGDLATIVRQTRSLVLRYRLPIAEPAARPLESLQRVTAARLDGQWQAVGESMLELDPSQPPVTPSGAPADLLYVPGLASGEVLRTAARWLSATGGLIVRDPTRLLASSAEIVRFGRGRTLAALASAPVVAVCVNPSRPDGGTVDPRRLLAEVGRALHALPGPPIPVVDVRLGAVFGGAA